MIRLKPEHKQWKQPTNPLIRQAEVKSEEEIVAVCQRWLDVRTEKARDDAILVFSSCLRHIIGRWLGSFPITWDHEDDLVQVGYESIMKSIDELETTEDVMNLVTNRALSAQTEYMNKNRSIVSPSNKTQKRRYNEGEQIPETEELNLETGHDRPDPCDEILQVDFIDAVKAACRDDTDRAIIHPDNWNKSEREVAERVGIDRATVGRRRAYLIERVRKEMYNA